MNILHVYRTYFPDTQGGLEETIRQICLATNKLGANSRVFTLSDTPSPARLERPECTVVRVKKHLEVSSCSMSFGTNKLFIEQAEWADIIHYHYPWPFGDYFFSLAKHKPSIVTYHSDIIRQRFLDFFYRPLRNYFLSSVDKIVCTSPNYFASSNILAEFSDKVCVIPIGIDESSYEQPTAPELLNKMTQTYGTDFFLFVGVLRYYKGLHILLDAIKGAGFNVVIVGSGPIESELLDQAKHLQLTNVKFAGYLSDEDKNALYSLAHAVVFPSYLRSEAFGLTLLEGAMHSLPLISTEVGSGTSHVNIDGTTGFVIPPAATQPLRTAMDKLFANPELARDMGKQARVRFKKLFNGELMGRRYYAEYQDLLNPTTAANEPIS